MNVDEWEMYNPDDKIHNAKPLKPPLASDRTFPRARRFQRSAKLVVQNERVSHNTLIDVIFQRETSYMTM
jgi:hypothetical protein